jgi:SAM-dependent methyltransferase
MATNRVATLAVSPRYQGAMAETYFRDHFTSEQVFGRQIQSEYFRPHCSYALTLLDFGCGDGSMLRVLPARHHIGIEVNPHCIDAIVRGNAIQAPTIDVRPDIGSVADGSIDVVISNHALEHTLRPLECLAEMKRVLVPGGRLVMVTPFDDWRAPGMDRWHPGDKDNHLFTWSPMNIGNLLHEAGFTVDQARLSARAITAAVLDQAPPR